MGDFPRITSLKIDGFKVFDNFEAKLGPLEVIVGANGAGKSSLFEFLKFIRDSMDQDIPPEIIEGGMGRQLFRDEKNPKLSWSCRVNLLPNKIDTYNATMLGPMGKPQMVEEVVSFEINGVTTTTAEGTSAFGQSHNENKKRQRLMLGLIAARADDRAHELRSFLAGGSFYSSFSISNTGIRNSSVIEQQPSLKESCRNLSAVINYFYTEYFDLFRELEQLAKLVLPGLRKLSVKARGGPGEVMAFWREDGVDADLTLADLSDGILRFLCWAVLCLHPQPPTLICIDEPELGLHPRVLPILASLFKRASEHTQIILATHSSYFLSQFDLAHIAVMRKEQGRAVWMKPNDHQVFHDMLADFGQDEIGNMHITDELEHLA